MIVDCDCHNYWTTAEVLLPYLDPPYNDWLRYGELPGPKGSFPFGQRPWIHPSGPIRKDVEAETQEDHYRLLRDKHLDPHDITHAILTGDQAQEVSTLANGYYAHALAKAYNDWVINEWLPYDDRLHASIVVAPQAPQLAAEEIRRLGHHPRVAQVLVSMGARQPYGDPVFHPIYEACAEVGIPFALHLGGEGGANARPMAVAPTTFFWETHALLPQAAQIHVASMIAQGVFEKWPELYMVVIECGVSWVPSVLWRLDSDFKALRYETPWLTMLPSEYCKRNIRFTTQPLDQPDKIEYLWKTLEAMDGKNTLMFASDYPHWDYDDVGKIQIPPDWRDNVLWKNAVEVYRKIDHQISSAATA